MMTSFETVKNIVNGIQRINILVGIKIGRVGFFDPFHVRIHNFVRRIDQSDGDIFISSMPVKDLVAGMNDVPKTPAEIAAGLPYRDYMTVGLLLPKLNLKNKTKIRTINNIVPDCWVYVQDRSVQLGRFQI